MSFALQAHVAAITYNGLFVTMPSAWPQSCCNIYANTEILWIIIHFLLHIKGLLQVWGTESRGLTCSFYQPAFCFAELKIKPSMLPGGWISCWGSISLLGLVSIDKLRQGSSQEPVQERWERVTKMGTGKAYFSSLREVKCIKWSIY